MSLNQGGGTGAPNPNRGTLLFLGILLFTCAFSFGMLVEQHLTRPELDQAKSRSERANSRTDRALEGWEKARASLEACLARAAELNTKLERCNGGD